LIQVKGISRIYQWLHALELLYERKRTLEYGNYL
jgi:hypothetical protein